MTTGYLTPAEFVLITGVSEAEWPSSNLNTLIEFATSEIDLKTGRTWQGVQTVTDQYLDGNGTDTINLFVSDLISLTTLAIASSETGTYTSVTVPTTNNVGDKVNFYNDGTVELKSTAEVSTFIDGRKTVKITYTYGASAPTDAVKRCCAYMVQNMIGFDETRKVMIEEFINYLKPKKFY